MTHALELDRDVDAGVAIADSLEGLSAIHRPDCAAVMWRRRPVQGLYDWIARLDPAHLPRTRVVLPPDAVRDAVRESCDIVETPDDPERDRLIDDVATLAEGFAKIMDAPYVRLRLDVVTNNACRKFHKDALTARLICTYRGTGTQYGVSPDGQDPTHVATAPAGAPIVLRGSLWPEDPPSGLLHRSPPIAGTGETRLLLVLDPLEEMIDESNHAVH